MSMIIFLLRSTKNNSYINNKCLKSNTFAVILINSNNLIVIWITVEKLLIDLSVSNNIKWINNVLQHGQVINYFYCPDFRHQKWSQ